MTKFSMNNVCILPVYNLLMECIIKPDIRNFSFAEFIKTVPKCTCNIKIKLFTSSTLLHFKLDKLNSIFILHD